MTSYIDKLPILPKSDDKSLFFKFIVPVPIGTFLYNYDPLNLFLFSYIQSLFFLSFFFRFSADNLKPDIVMFPSKLCMMLIQLHVWNSN